MRGQIKRGQNVTIDDQQVVSRAPVQLAEVVSKIKDEGIITGPANEHVRACAAIQPVIAGPAVQRVIAGIAGQFVGQIIAGNIVASGPAGGIFNIGTKGDGNIVCHGVGVRIGAGHQRYAR